MEKRKIQMKRTEVLGMKNKKGITLIALIITVIVSLMVIRKNKNSVLVRVQEPPKTKIEKSYDEETGLYYIQDENTGEIIYASREKDDPGFEFYQEHQDYNPNPLQPRRTNLDDFLMYEDGGEMN